MSEPSASVNPYSPPEAELERPIEEGEGAPLYFLVGTTKLVVLSIATFGLYERYWFYKNWQLIRERTQANVSPFWRAVFAPLWGFSFCSHVQDHAEDLECEVNLPPALFGGLYLLFAISPNLLADPWSYIVGVLSFLPVTRMQNEAAQVNRRAGAGSGRFSEFTIWNWLWILGGAGLWILLGLGVTAELTSNPRF